MCESKEKRIEQKVMQDINQHKNQHTTTRLLVSKIRANQNQLTKKFTSKKINF